MYGYRCSVYGEQDAMPSTTTATPHGHLYDGRRSRGVECWYLGGGYGYSGSPDGYKEVRQTLGYGVLHRVRTEIGWCDGGMGHPRDHGKDQVTGCYKPSAYYVTSNTPIIGG